MTRSDPRPVSYPRHSARTRRFTLGAPRAFVVSPDGRRVTFLRSKAGDDPVTCLYLLDLDSGTEHLVADPRSLHGGEDDVPAQERARRERSREQAGGVVGYATDSAFRHAVFALAGRVFAADLTTPFAVRELPVRTPALDPRVSPDGRYVGYVHVGALRVIGLHPDGDADAADRALAEPDSATVTFGLAEFIAGEEMGRHRGYWWAPDGSALLVARADTASVPRLHIADPANPATPPVEVAYPAAGTGNAEVTLWLVGLDGRQRSVALDPAAFPYLATASWGEHGPLVSVQSRDQRTMRTLAIDPASGAAEVLREDTDAEWLDIVPGVPAFTAGGKLVCTADEHDTRRLLVDGAAATPAGLQVRAILSVDGDTVLISACTESTQPRLWLYGPQGLRELTDRPGVYGGCHRGGTTVVTAQSLDHDGVRAYVLHDGPGGDRRQTPITSHAHRPELSVNVELLSCGKREIRTALVLPVGHAPGSEPLPVLMDPYGGPHAQRVLSARRSYLEPQWLADQGFAVIIADGQGTPGRGPAFERAVHQDLAGPVLDDQVDALQGVADAHPGLLDLGRVAIRGWSFGGYLAALAVLRRPDVFHAAVAGAPVTDWRLYDTHYTERYLGHPAECGDAYNRSSLIGDAPNLRRPLLLIHGLADDNVVVAHTLRLSSALLAAGRTHTVLPLSGVTHMTPQESVAENLLLLQVDFLRRSLGPASR